jgi:hypothetical protein
MCAVWRLATGDLATKAHNPPKVRERVGIAFSLFVVAYSVTVLSRILLKSIMKASSDHLKGAPSKGRRQQGIVAVKHFELSVTQR